MEGTDNGTATAAAKRRASAADRGDKAARPRLDAEAADEPSPRKQAVLEAFGAYRDALDAHHDQRERVIKCSRDITALSKKMIFALLRITQEPLEKVFRDVQGKHKQALDLFRKMAADLQGSDAAKYNRQATPAIQEYIEAMGVWRFLEHNQLITKQQVEDSLDIGLPLPVTDEDYLLGISDLPGEVNRYCINAIGKGDHEAVRRCLEFMRHLKAGISVVLCACGAKGLLKKAEVLDSSLEKTEKAYYSMSPLRPLRAGGLRGYTSSGGRPKPDTLRMGQSDGGGKKGGGGGSGGWRNLFGFHPLAVLGAASLLASGYAMIYRPYKAWSDEQREKRSKQQQQAPKIKHTEEAIAKFPFAQKSVVFVLGGPGSGKGTNSARLVEDFGFVHLSAGDLLREEQKRPDSQYGKLIEHYIREGLIVPHEVTIGLLRNAMMDHPECDRFLIDGFPRNLVQAKAFEDTVCQAKKVLFFECPEETMLARLLDRGKTSGRSDDNVESIRKRFRTYANDTKPVIDAFAKEGKILTVSCQGSVDDVYAKTRAQVAELLGTIEKKAE
ncbi:bifunctional uridylate/adenylate kinase [Coemansia javaensis]|uniref:Uridylate kinase n=1 Tax=Coemansia javaensis TaxID=2761396 RepID=A0A9W8HBB8_9FUNG|nr:bifunctional uridylate/adenylate kinase [Coemansia javaensis]